MVISSASRVITAPYVMNEFDREIVLSMGVMCSWWKKYLPSFSSPFLDSWCAPPTLSSSPLVVGSVADLAFLISGCTLLSLSSSPPLEFWGVVLSSTFRRPPPVCRPSRCWPHSLLCCVLRFFPDAIVATVRCRNPSYVFVLSRSVLSMVVMVWCKECDDVMCCWGEDIFLLIGITCEL